MDDSEFKRRGAEAQRGAENSLHENEISRQIIGAAIEVHRELGPGLIESAYDAAFCRELQLRGLRFSRQGPVSINYKGVKVGTDLRFDFLIENKVVVDLKAKDQIVPIDKQKVLTYLRLLGLHLGLIINFHVEVLKAGVNRVVNNLAEQKPPGMTMVSRIFLSTNARPQPYFGFAVYPLRPSAPLRLCV